MNFLRFIRPFFFLLSITSIEKKLNNQERHQNMPLAIERHSTSTATRSTA